MTRGATTPIEINLTGVVLAMREDEPAIYASAFDAAASAGLPSGPFDPQKHRTLELGLRSFASEQAGLSLGYVEQLYTFGDRARHAGESDGASRAPHIVSIGYLALTRIDPKSAARPHFHDLYGFFPWEDWRGGRPEIIAGAIEPRLRAWSEDRAAEAASLERQALSRADRVAMLFGLDGCHFDEEKVLERFELLYEAGLADEAKRDARAPHGGCPPLGRAMQFDHRRILATALGRIRAKLKYRPLVFELMPPEFTLTDLQRKVEAISGHHLHKQNFRRLVESGGLVEPSGGQTTTGGRPAALFRFRHEVLTERPAPGLRLGRGG